MALSMNDLPAFVKLLTDALSQDENLRKAAEGALSDCENRSGFCSCLLEIISGKDLQSESNARWLASVYFKNSVNRYWRQRIISDKEKSYLRKKLLDLLREENLQVANQLATIVSKIARIDYPKEWQDLFTNIGGQVLSSDVLISQRACMILYQTLKELSTKRLAVDQRNFAEITSQNFDYIWHQWCRDTQTILHEFCLMQSLEHKIFPLEWKEKLQLTCNRWLLCLKMLRQMLVFGVPTDAKSVRVVPQIKEVCRNLLRTDQSLLQCRFAFEHVHHDFCEFAEKMCLKLMKVLVTIQNTHPFSFSDPTVISPILDFCYRAITEAGCVGSFEYFLIQCMILLKSVLECTEYRLRNSNHVDDMMTSLEKLKRYFVGQAESTLEQFMTNERIVLLCKTLILRYFILTSKDLEQWALDPESFYHEQQLIQWSEKMRPCAEALYLTMLEKYRQIMAPLVVEVLTQVTDSHTPMGAGTTSDFLLKDAVYTAVGFAHYEISNHLSFKAWFEGALLPELRNTNSSGHIMRRRIAWLLGQWVSEIKDEIKNVAYAALLNLLRDNDLAVKIQVLNLLSLMIDLLGEKIVPFSDQLVKFFPKVWEESSVGSLLRIQLICALRNFVDALGPWSPMCYNMLLPILQASIDINNPDELNLLEDGMLLWETMLNYDSSMMSQLLELFHYLVAIIGRSFDHITVAMKIIEGYIVLGGKEFLNLHGSEVAKILDAIVGNANNKGIMCTFPIIEMLLQCFPGDSPHLLSLVLQRLTIIFIGGGDESDPAKEAIRAFAGSILARLVVQNSSYFAFLIAQPSLSMAFQEARIRSNQNVPLQIVDAWIDKIDSVAFTRRKAYGLALCILLTLRGIQILEKLEQILSVCSSILASDTEQYGNEVYSYDCSLSDNLHENSRLLALQQSKDFKKRQIESADPIKKISLADILRESVQTCATLYGDEAFRAAMSSLHPTLSGQLHLFLKA